MVIRTYSKHVQSVWETALQKRYIWMSRGFIDPVDHVFKLGP